jgi:hypothetical protein
MRACGTVDSGIVYSTEIVIPTNGKRLEYLCLQVYTEAQTEHVRCLILAWGDLSLYSLHPIQWQDMCYGPYVSINEGGEAEVSNMSSWRMGLVGQVQSHDGPKDVLHPFVGGCGIIICVGLVVIYAATGEASGAAVVLFVGSTRDASRVCSR